MTGIHFQARADFSHLCGIQAGSGGPPNLSSKMYHGDSFPRGKWQGGVKLTSHLYLLLRLRMVKL
jgi:hypothetical protein